MAGQNKPFLRCHFGLWEVVTRIFWCKYTKYFIYNPLSINIHTQMKLCVIVVIPPGGEAVGRPGSDPPTPSLHTNSSAAVDSRWVGGVEAILQQGDSDIFLPTKHLHHLPILQRADGENRLIKRRKKGVMFFDCESKGQPLTAMQMSPCVSVKWPFVFNIWSVPSLLWNCPMSHRSKPTVWKTPPPFGKQSRPVSSTLLPKKIKNDLNC